MRQMRRKKILTEKMRNPVNMFLDVPNFKKILDDFGNNVIMRLMRMEKFLVGKNEKSIEHVS